MAPTSIQILIALAALIVAIFASAFAIYRSSARFRDREKKSVERFRRSRESLKQTRELFRKNALGHGRQTSAYLSADDEVPLFAGQDWLLPRPIPLEEVRLRFGTDPWEKIELPRQTLPMKGGIAYEKYSDAISNLDKPSKFENRIQYRLLEINGENLLFSPREYHYFDKIDYGDYLMLEFSHHVTGGRKILNRDNRKRILKRLRTPADYMVLTGISTLTLIHDGTDLRFLMHLRGQTETAYASGTFHVIPAGEFQPSCRAPVSFAQDFDLWKNIIREYAEELAGMEEYNGDRTVSFDYESEPFVSLNRERAKGNIKAFYLGTGLDVITFQGEILTVVVFKEEVFNQIFKQVLGENLEGKIITDKNRWGRPFNEKEFKSYEAKNILASGETILKLAWKNREFFKSLF